MKIRDIYVRLFYQIMHCIGEKRKEKKELKLFPLQYFQLSIDYSRIFLLMSVCTYVTRLNIAILFKYILKV